MSVRLLGLTIFLFGSFNLMLGWAFSSMVEPGLQGLDWWVEVAGNPGFVIFTITLSAILLGGLHLLIGSPKA